MATPDWVADTEEIVGESHPTRSDTKNRCGITIQTMLEVEHDVNGMHDARITRLMGEIGTFAGNGVARTISLSNSNLTPKKVIVWETGSGSEQLSNGSFLSNIDNWIFLGGGGGSTISWDGGDGTPVGCIRANGLAGGACQFGQDIYSTLISGKTYNWSGYVKSGTSGNESYQFLIGSTVLASGTSSGSWVQRTGSFVYNGSDFYFSAKKNATGAGYMLFDELSITETSGNAPLKLSSMDENSSITSRSKATEQTDVITNLQVGSFDVESGCNASGITNYYLVLGTDTGTTFSGDGGTAGSDPSWVTSGTLETAPMIGSDDATVSQVTNSANTVESEIWTAFTHEHGADGTHSVTLAEAEIETGTYTATSGADDRVITLSNTSLDIQYLYLYRLVSPVEPVFSCSASMTADNTKLETTAAFATDYIQDVNTTGQFTVGTLCNVGTYVYYYIALGFPT